MKRRKSEGSSIIEPDMTPMIDIVFQLLTFFMIVINFENTEADERVKLPKDLLAKPPEVKPKYELTLNFGLDRNSAGQVLDPEPKLLYNGNEYTVSKFRPQLESEKRIFLLHPEKPPMSEFTVIIRADSEVPTGKVQELIKLAQDVGFSKFSLRATQEEEMRADP